MEKMSRNIENYENITLVDFAASNLRAGSDSVSYLLFDAFFTYFGNQKLNLTERYSRIPLVDKIDKEFKYEEDNNICSDFSAQQYFYFDFLDILIMEIKGNLLASFSLNILREQKYGNFSAEIEDFTLEQDARMEYMVNKIRNVMEYSNQAIRKCDPDNRQHIWGSTYEKLTNTFQGVIVNERNMYTGTCGYTCDDFFDDEINRCDKTDPLCTKKNHDYRGRAYKCYMRVYDDVVHLVKSVSIQ